MTDPRAEILRLVDEMQEWEDLAQEAQTALLDCRTQLHQTMAAYAEQLQTQSQRPPVGFLDWLYWDQPAVPVATIALFLDCHASTVWRHFGPRLELGHCPGGCGRQTSTLRESRSGYYSFPLCEACSAEQARSSRARALRDDRATREYVAELLQRGVELPPYHPDTVIQLPNATTVTTGLIEEVRQSIVYVGYPLDSARAGQIWTQEPRAGCLICGSDYVAVMMNGRLRPHTHRDNVGVRCREVSAR